MSDQITGTATEETSPFSMWQLLGPLFLFSAYALAPHDALLFCIGVAGLVLSEKWQMRGLAYAFALLCLVAGIEHLWLTPHHLWQFGLESAYGMAFCITALHADVRKTSIQSLHSKIDLQKSSLGNLEQELQQFQQDAASQNLLASEKIGTLQKELEEGRIELSSLEILNEVLRKTAAKAMEERDAARETLAAAHHRVDHLTQELAAKEARGEDPVALQELLNEARLEREQARLISETLARLHARENSRARALEEKLATLQAEKNDSPAMEWSHLQEKVKALTTVETLYKQLRAQFDEKTQVLHQTRVALFRADTQLQTLAIEKEQRDRLGPFDPLLNQELTTLDRERSQLEEENRHLQDLVTHLIGGVPSQKKK